MTLKLRHDDFRTVTRRHTFEMATDLDGELYGAARELFRAAFEEVRGRNRGVRLIGIAATNLGSAAEADLFEPPSRRRLRDLSAAVDHVREKYGFAAVTPGSALRGKRRRRSGARLAQVLVLEAEPDGAVRRRHLRTKVAEGRGYRCPAPEPRPCCSGTAGSNR